MSLKEVKTSFKQYKNSPIYNYITVENGEVSYDKAKLSEFLNLSGEYQRHVSDWRQLCRSCHKKMDWRPKEICRNGHFLREVGILIDNRGSRICKECKRINAKHDYKKHKIKIIARVNAYRKKIRSTLSA